MAAVKSPELSVILPVHNEAAGLAHFHEHLSRALKKLALTYEYIYIDDGSTDNSGEVLLRLAKTDKHIRVLSLTRNFGKEIATTAGIHAAKGQAIVMLDSDGQHPVELISEFVRRWQAGASVVVGLRTANQNEGFMKRYGSKLFYAWFNRFTGVRLQAGSTDFRLIDRSAQQEFIKMTEHNRVTRGLIDWLGYQREYVEFMANPRVHGDPAYSFKKLFKLAIDSVISLSSSPLYIAAYIGGIIVPLAIILGVFMLVEMLVGDPLNLNITGGAYILVLELLLIGILLLSQGIIGLYLSHIHSETQGRPLYIINRKQSVGIDNES